MLLKPIKKQIRENWEDNIKKTLSKNEDKKDEAVLNDFLNDNDLDDWEW